MAGDRWRTLAEARLAANEAAYRAALIEALRVCAAGVWGLFGQNAPTHGAPASSAAANLFALADEIDRALAALGMEPFALHAQFAALWGRQDENQPGEPKLAQRLLAEVTSGRPIATMP